MDFIDPRIEAYALANTAAESELLRELNRETHAKILQPRMLSGHLQGRVLSMLSRLMQPSRILEIGTYTGYSALCLAEGLPMHGMLHTIDINEELESMVRKYIHQAGLERKIHMHIGDALKIIPEISQTWDMVFIDADKENYINYYNLIIDWVRPGGLIIADNVLWSGKVLEENNDIETTALQNFTQYVKLDKRVDSLLLPIRDGLQILRKKN